jgi:hypothetical protein
MNTSNDFVTDLINAMPVPSARMACVAFLSRWAGSTVYIPSESRKERRQRAAENMLANGMTDPDIARAIFNRFQVSMRTAQRDVKEARKMSEKPVVSECSNN